MPNHPMHLTTSEWDQLMASEAHDTLAHTREVIG
jgi:hypothetical protein